MAFTSFAVTAVNPASNGALTYSATDNANGNAVVNDGHVTLLVKNPTGGAITVTAVSVPDDDGRTGDVSASIPAGGEYAFGLLSPALFNQRSGDVGQVHVTFSAAGCTMVALQLG